MTRPTDPAKMEHAVQLYLSGKGTTEAATTVGISKSPLIRELRKRGVTRPRRIELVGVGERYLAGESVLGLAQSYGVERGVIERHLREAAIPKRTAGEQARIVAANMSAAQRKARAAAAHAAKRGHPNSPESLRAAARTRESQGVPQSRAERLMLGWLEKRGQSPRIQAAIDRYNVDLAFAGVAVEMLGGEWHAQNPKHRARTKAILNAGWNVLFVWDTPSYPLKSAAADYAVTFAEETRLNPAAIREYRVIRGDGEFVAGGRLDQYELTYVPTARSGMDASEVGRLGAAMRWGKSA